MFLFLEIVFKNINKYENAETNISDFHPYKAQKLLLLKERKKKKKKDLAKITHVSLRTSNCGEIDIAYHVYMLTQGQAHFNWILSSISNIIGVYYLARAKHHEISR